MGTAQELAARVHRDGMSGQKTVTVHRCAQATRRHHIIVEAPLPTVCYQTGRKAGLVALRNMPAIDADRVLIATMEEVPK